MRLIVVVLAVVAMSSTAATFPVAGEPPAQQTESTVQDLSNRVSELERKVNRVAEGAAGSGLALFLTACVCALWANGSGRNPWVWFFLGLFFSVITLLVMLWKHGRDLQEVDGIGPGSP